MPAGDLMRDLLAPGGRVDPYPVYEKLRRAGPVVRLDDGWYAVTGYQECDQLLRDPRCRVEDAAWLDDHAPGWRGSAAVLRITESMLFTNPPDHARVRRAASRAFTARRVAELREPVARLCAELLDAMAGRGAVVDFMAEFAYLLPVSVICELLGVPRADVAWFRPRATDLSLVFELMPVAGPLDAADRATVELREYFVDLVAARRRAPRDDLISGLVAQSDRLTSDELLANLVLLLIAGFETTTNLLGNGLSILLDAPEQARRLRAEPARAPAYVAEMLRYDPPVQLTSRRTAQPLTVAGRHIEADASIEVLLAAANRDPARYPAPERFDPDRDDGQPLSFGGGIHYCLGSALARLEGEVAFPAVLARFPGLRRAGEPTRRDRLTLRGYATLPVSPTAG